jgi:hypothetical protein
MPAMLVSLPSTGTTSGVIRRTAFLFLLFCCAGRLGLAQNGIPQFKDYPVRTVYRGKNARLLLSSDARTFKTRLTQALKGRPNFAGHFIVTTWGCGTGCQVGAVIDASTGRVFWLPFPVGQTSEVDEDFRPVEFRLDSKLIIFSGVRVDRDEPEGARFYKFEDGRFKFLKFIKREAGGGRSSHQAAPRLATH